MTEIPKRRPPFGERLTWRSKTCAWLLLAIPLAWLPVFLASEAGYFRIAAFLTLVAFFLIVAGFFIGVIVLVMELAEKRFTFAAWPVLLILETGIPLLLLALVDTSS